MSLLSDVAEMISRVFAAVTRGTDAENRSLALRDSGDSYLLYCYKDSLDGSWSPSAQTNY